MVDYPSSSTDLDTHMDKHTRTLPFSTEEESALLLAASKKDFDKIASLLEGCVRVCPQRVCAFVNCYDRENGHWTPLHYAAMRGSVDAVRILLQYGANIATRSMWGSGPLFLSAEGGHTACLVALIEAGADLNAQNDSGSTPLHAASRYGHAECVRLLLNALSLKHCVKEAVDTKDYEGWTPLHRASNEGSVACVVLLLRYGADSTAKNNKGKTPALCVRKNRPSSNEIVSIIQEFESIPDIKEPEC